MIKYVDFVDQHRSQIKVLKKIFTKTLKNGSFILGPELLKFEKNFSNYIGTKNSIGVSNGTSALYLSLKFFDLPKGSEIITVGNSYLAAVSTIYLAGLKPIFSDIGDDLNIDLNDAEKKITKKTKAIVIVHLTGRPANMKKALYLKKKYNLKIIEDCSQAVGATYFDKKVGSFGDVGCFSLHPLKNLGGIGDAGIVTTNNSNLANFLRKARNHGHSSRDQCDFWSFNMRLDPLQASILNFKLKNLEKVINKRIKNAEFYIKKLSKYCISVPKEENFLKNVYHTFIIRIKHRDKLKRYLETKKIETKIHVKINSNKLIAAKKYNLEKIKLKKTDAFNNEILSLPISETLKRKDQVTIIKYIKKFYNEKIYKKN